MGFRLRSIVPSESDVSASIRKALEIEMARGRVHSFVRVNSGGAYDKTGRFIRFCLGYLGGRVFKRGHPDFYGTLADGRHFDIEVKRPGEKPSADQQDWIDHQAQVCPALIVSSVEEVREGLGLT